MLLVFFRPFLGTCFWPLLEKATKWTFNSDSIVCTAILRNRTLMSYLNSVKAILPNSLL